MLSVNKLRVGQEAYQLSGVAESLDDYFTGSGEARGQWVGGGADRLGLSGAVGPDDLRAVLAGLRPGTGGLTPNGQTLRPHPRRVPGFDLTFKVPKSASVLYAVSDDPRVQGAVIEAGEAAMRAAVGWLEREAVRVQRGSHNVAYLERLDPGNRALAGPHRLPTSGLVAASFRHRTSRAGDPYLHWHVLVANLVEGTDGRWSSLVHPEIYRHATAAGSLFQAAFRAELTRTLGIEWRPGRHVPEIAGIPQNVLDAFSKRAAELEAWLAATGTPTTAAGRQAGILATRRHKAEQEHQRFDGSWKAEAEALGWGPVMADGLMAAALRRNPTDGYEAWRIDSPAAGEWTVSRDDWTSQLLRRHLTHERSTFTFADLADAIARTLDAGSSIETIERLAGQVIASNHVVDIHGDGEAQRWTSRELFDVERQFIAAIAAETPTAIDQATVTAALDARVDLGRDQWAAVELLTTTDAAVSVLIGPAGTGKTHTIDAIRAVYQCAGVTVRGAAPSARAALELASATGMPTTTLHRLLNTPPALGSADRGALLVIDEAGMADIRILASVVTGHLAAGGRVLLAGDHHQLPEIGAGGGFAYAATHAAAVAELTTNRRQRDRWEQHALDELRNGDITAAVTAYVDHGRVGVACDHGDLVERAIEHWAAARANGRQPIMLAGTNDLVDRLNHAAITHLIDTGQLPDCEPVPYGNTSLRVGERVVLRRNSDCQRDVHGQLTRIVNGHTGAVTNNDEHQLNVALDNGPTVVLDDGYLAHGGYVTHAYALTSHRSQGGTWDTAIAVGADTLSREAAYVQLSRGRHANHIILTDPEITEILQSAARDAARHDHGITHPDDEPSLPVDHLIDRLSRSASKQLAHAIDTAAARVDELVTNVPYAELVARAAAATYAEHLTTIEHGTTRAELQQQQRRLVQVGERIDLGQLASPTDRHNVGMVTAINNNTGQATLRFTSHNGRHAERTFGWSDLRFVEPRQPPTRRLDDDARRTLERLSQELQRTTHSWETSLQAHGAQRGDADLYTRAVARVLDQAASQLAAEQPAWLHQHLGHRPADITGARTWHNAIAAIARWQLTHPNGPDTDPAGAHQLQTWIAQTRQWLDADRAYVVPSQTRSNAATDDRRAELEQILETAPPDCRHLIDRLQSGQLAFDDLNDLLHTALDQQDARRLWIIEHWPHIVEHTELNRAPKSQARTLEIG